MRFFDTVALKNYELRNSPQKSMRSWRLASLCLHWKPCIAARFTSFNSQNFSLIDTIFSYLFRQSSVDVCAFWCHSTTTCCYDMSIV